MEILLATANPNKVAEYQEIFRKLNIKTISCADLPPINEPQENGNTFKENAIIKATYYGEYFKKSCIADDSGLNVVKLNNFPGIYSARVIKNKDYRHYGANLLESKLKEVKTEDFSAFFICNIAYYDFIEKKCTSFEGRVDGRLTFPPSTEDGFGYDIMFIPNGFDKTFAQLGKDIKNKISHRARALELFYNWFKNKVKV